MEKGKSLHPWLKMEKVTRCKSENHVPIAAVSKEPRILDDPTKATDCESQVLEHQQIGREKFLDPMSQARRTQARRRATWWNNL